MKQVVFKSDFTFEETKFIGLKSVQVTQEKFQPTFESQSLLSQIVGYCKAIWPESMRSRSRLLGFESLPYYLYSLIPGISHSKALSLSFFVCKRGIIMVPNSLNC